MTHKIVRKLTYEGDLSWIIHTLKRGAVPSNGTIFLGNHKISSDTIAHDGTEFNVGHEPSAHSVGSQPLEDLADHELVYEFAMEIRRRIEDREPYERTFDPLDVRSDGMLGLLYFTLRYEIDSYNAEIDRQNRVAKEEAAKNAKKI